MYIIQQMNGKINLSNLHKIYKSGNFMDFQEILTGSGVKLNRIFTDRDLHGDITQFNDRRVERHPHYEFLYILRGESEYAFNGTLVTLKQGDGLIIRPWILHQGGYLAKNTPGLHIWFSLAKNFFYGRVCELRENDYIAHHFSATSPELYAVMRKWEKRCPDRDSGTLAALFALLLQEYVEDLTLNEQKDDDRMEMVVRQMRSRISECNGVDCTLENLSKIFGYSKSHLSHSFRKYTGQSVGEYINALRVQYMTIALERGMTQKEIASDLGFSSPASFWLWKKRLSEKD